MANSLQEDRKMATLSGINWPPEGLVLSSVDKGGGGSLADSGVCRGTMTYAIPYGHRAGKGGGGGGGGAFYSLACHLLLTMVCHVRMTSSCADIVGVSHDIC